MKVFPCLNPTLQWFSKSFGSALVCRACSGVHLEQLVVRETIVSTYPCSLAWYAICSPACNWNMPYGMSLKPIIFLAMRTSIHGVKKSSGYALLQCLAWHSKFHVAIVQGPGSGFESEDFWHFGVTSVTWSNNAGSSGLANDVMTSELPRFAGPGRLPEVLWRLGVHFIRHCGLLPIYLRLHAIRIHKVLGR